ncbi:MAG: protease complex subunit PrcB family protein [Anaerolineales bacterium]|nr:protease complex subunit PrcB family protein [Anaerolineales bacterium]
MLHKKISRWTAISLFLWLIMVAWLQGCAPGAPTPIPSESQAPDLQPATGQAVPFTSLGQGNSLTAEVEKPTLFVAGNSKEAARFAEWLDDPDLKARLQALDFEEQFVVIVFAGVKGSSGYGVEVREISVVPGIVSLKVEFTEPAAGQISSDVISHPYHVISLSKEQIDATLLKTWAVIDMDGNEITQIDYP